MSSATTSTNNPVKVTMVRDNETIVLFVDTAKIEYNFSWENPDDKMDNDDESSFDSNETCDPPLLYPPGSLGYVGSPRSPRESPPASVERKRVKPNTPKTLPAKKEADISAVDHDLATRMETQVAIGSTDAPVKNDPSPVKKARPAMVARQTRAAAKASQLGMSLKAYNDMLAEDEMKMPPPAPVDLSSKLECYDDDDVHNW
ncbi:MAG: hypothetical protein SGARI_004543 [Bacillariaceae sp.]